jgi:hypothetical protein
MIPWLTFWTRSADIAMGAPEVIHRRLTLMGQPGPWPLTTVIESQVMVWEKMMAAWQAGLTIYTAMWPRLWTGGQAFSGSQLRATRDAVRLANKVMLPYSTTVNANVKRLRKPRSR